MSNFKSEQSEIYQLENKLQELCIEQKNNVEEEIVNEKISETDDDGYDSCNSDEKEAKLDLDDEKVLEPLSIISETKPDVFILHIGKGLHDNRYNPYTRQHSSQNSIPPIVEPKLKETSSLSKPNVRILKTGDTKNPSKLDASVTWTNKQEIAIDSCQLPEDTYYREISCENKVQIFIQINPNVSELKSFLADVKVEIDPENGSKKHFIGPIVIFLKTELAESQEKYLLAKTTMEERTDAYNLVQNKDLSQLTCGIGPHKDTVLSVLCAQRNPAHPGQTYAQIHAVIHRLVSHPEKRVKQTVFSLNNNGISAFEISAITNNSVVACYLAEIMYNLTDEVEIALNNLLCKDSQGNTIIHLLARKGDSNKETLKSLLDLLLSDGSKIFKNLPNSRKQYPIHIAAQSLKNQPETIKILYENMPKSFEVMDDEGMTALHYACQRSKDVDLVQKILSYKKDNINVINKDGLSTLDLISRRSQIASQSQGLFSIERAKQQEIIKLIKNNGGTAGSYFPPCKYIGDDPKGSTEQTMGSPYSGHSSVESPINISDPFLNSNSVEFHHQSSPDSVNLGSPHSLLSTPSYQGSPYNNPDSPNSHQSYEDQLASEILTQFPEISNVLGQILEEDQ